MEKDSWLPCHATVELTGPSHAGWTSQQVFSASTLKNDLAKDQGQVRKQINLEKVSICKKEDYN